MKLINNNNLKNNDLHYSLSLVNIKPKSIDNKIFFNNINNTNIRRKRNFINNIPSKKVFIKQYLELEKNRKIKKLINFIPNKTRNNIYDKTLIMPILNNKYYNNNYTFQDGQKEY